MVDFYIECVIENCRLLVNTLGWKVGRRMFNSRGVMVLIGEHMQDSYRGQNSLIKEQPSAGSSSPGQGISSRGSKK
ncbi:hypothetical protein TSUD_239120 [Trifolium subterraneum]|uniref:Uncharacterized protein n=1 Tax=Trifolium subterraneum TaxID=3900 RepID=A0A2Z6NTA1_TRISU|nr:hypothetical protein TSUD_239120 [Trifolium subterraneum]